jgi:subtilisin family serine protease
MGIAALGRRLLAVSAVAGLTAATVAAGVSPASAEVSPGAASGASVDGQVLAELADRGTTDFFVYLREQADLSPARSIAGKAAKGRFVYQTLTSTAEASQAGLRAQLTAAGAEFTPFWIANVVLVRGDQRLLSSIAARSDVARIEAHQTWQIPAPTRSPDDVGINVVEWGVLNINADDVWNEFGVTGQGTVVGNIDTGVDFNHPAVVGQYRGNTGSGFNHNFNWFDPTGICGNTPCDNNDHGTHTMGTMVGDDGGSNQIGVAPGAEWIAAKGCGTSSCSDTHLLASGQWMVAPTDLNGNNPNPAMAPDVVNNSWGGGRGDTWYQATINAWISAGIFPMFSAGNSGPGCNTANSPGDNLPAYAVGAYDINNNIAGFSSRGSSGVSGSEIKPNIAAPGVSVRSSVNGGGYANFSGTSMASPHAAGVVALAWSAEPALRGDINGTRAVLDDTARDVSATGCGGSVDDNNIFGEGRIDALAAVEEATGGGGGEPPDVVFEDDFETSNGWTTNFDGSDTATTGQWERANPAGTSFSGTTLQLGTTTSGSNDLVTGAVAGSNAGVADIDGGDTTIRSPAISLPAGASIELEFNWYFAHLNNATSADYLRVTVVGSSTSTVLQQLGSATNRAGSWSSASVNLSGFAGQTVRLLVEAADAGGGSLIEAGIDDVTVTAS